jgi:hypothetical protein
MEEFSTAPIPWSTRAEDHERPPAFAARRQPENRSRALSSGLETNEQEDAPEDGEPKHDLDISV